MPWVTTTTSGAVVLIMSGLGPETGLGLASDSSCLGLGQRQFAILMAKFIFPLFSCDWTKGYFLFDRKKTG